MPALQSTLFSRLVSVFQRERSPAHPTSAQAMSPGLLWAGWANQYIARRLTSIQDPRVAQAAGAYREAILQMTASLPGFGAVHETQMLLWHAMRQYSTTLDAAIRNRRTLEGHLEISSDDEGLALFLNDYAEQIAVGFLGGQATLRGLDTYLTHLAESADEYGLAAGEMQFDERARAIRRLVVPSVRTLSIADRDTDDTWELYQRRRGKEERLDDRPAVQVLSFNAPVEGPWPPPLAWSATKSTEVILRMSEAVLNGWWRFGDPSLLLGLEFDKEADIDTESVTYTGADNTTTTVSVPSALIRLKDAVEAVMNARRTGQVGDAYTSVRGGKVVNEVLGKIEDGLMRYFREQASVFDSHIVALSKTPVWMYPHIVPGRGEGLGGILASNEASIALADADRRNARKERLAREVLDMVLVLEGSPQWIGQYDIHWQGASILDDQAEAQARLTNAQADAAVIENARSLYTEEGTRAFSGDAERMLEEAGLYMMMER